MFFQVQKHLWMKLLGSYYLELFLNVQIHRQVFDSEMASPVKNCCVLPLILTLLCIFLSFCIGNKFIFLTKRM